MPLPVRAAQLPVSPLTFPLFIFVRKLSLAATYCTEVRRIVAATRGDVLRPDLFTYLSLPWPAKHFLWLSSHMH